MPYPFARALTFSDFKELLIKDYGCQWKTTEALNGETNEKIVVTYLELQINGQTLEYPISIENENEFLMWSVIRSICRRLQIDPSSFGLTLG